VGDLLVFADRGTDPVANLAREELIFDGVEEGSSPQVLRFWVNSECLVRGRARSPKYGWYRESVAAELGVPVFERATGGGVVYQDLGNLNWSLFLKTSGKLLSPRAVFESASNCVVEALKALGVPAYFSPPNRIDAAGRKVSGMAARSTVHTLLVHGTLLLETDLERLNMVCIPPEGCPPVSNVSEFSKEISVERATGSIVEHLKRSGFRPRMS
jgi:lipoate---protein ligase